MSGQQGAAAAGRQTPLWLTVDLPDHDEAVTRGRGLFFVSRTFGRVAGADDWPMARVTPRDCHTQGAGGGAALGHGGRRVVP